MVGLLQSLQLVLLSTLASPSIACSVSSQLWFKHDASSEEATVDGLAHITVEICGGFPELTLENPKTIGELKAWYARPIDDPKRCGSHPTIRYNKEMKPIPAKKQFWKLNGKLLADDYELSKHIDSRGGKM